MQLVKSNVHDHADGAHQARNDATLRTVSTPTHVTPVSTDSPDGGGPVWRIPCGDMINRERAITVFVDNGEVVVVGPPGESARLAGSQLDELRTALEKAATLAER